MSEDKKKKVKIEIYESTLENIKNLFKQYQDHKKKHPDDKYDAKFSDNFIEWTCQIIDSMFLSNDKLNDMTSKFMSSLEKSLENFDLGDLGDLGDLSKFSESLDKFRESMEGKKEKKDEKKKDPKDVKN